MSRELAAPATTALLDANSVMPLAVSGETTSVDATPHRPCRSTLTVLLFFDVVLLLPLGVLSLLFVRSFQSQAILHCLQAGLEGAALFTLVAAALNPRVLHMPRRISDQCFLAFLLWGAVVAIVYASSSSHLSAAGVPFRWVVTWFVLGAFCVIGSRVAVGQRFRLLHRRGRLATRVALVGSAMEIRQLREFLERPEQRNGYKVAGCFIDEPAVPEDDGIESFRTADSLPYAIGALQVEAVIVAPPWGDRAAMNRLCGRLRAVPAAVYLLTEIAEVNPSLAKHRHRLAGRVVIELWTLPLATWRAWVKRTEDVVISTALLLMLMPIMVMIAVIIRLLTPGPVIFRQMRYGFANRPIRVSKFRTMRHDLGDAAGTWATLRNDPRVTRFGAFLRRTSLDELPQLFDVLRGDMSLVGPRAHPIEMRVDGLYYADVVRSYATRHLVKPGITGLAQINGSRGHVDSRAKAELRVQFDVQYIENWSLAQDLKILWRSVFVGFVNENAY